MQHLFLNKELSSLAKEKGFDEPCFGYYRPLKQWMKPTTAPNWTNKEGNYYFMYKPNPFGDRTGTVINTGIKSDWIAASTYQQIIDWFRDKHQIHIWAQPQTWDGIVYTANWCYKNDILWTFHDAGVKEGMSWKRYVFDNPTDALIKAIEEAFKLI